MLSSLVIKPSVINTHVSLMVLICSISVVWWWPCPSLKCLSAVWYGCTDIPEGLGAHAVFSLISETMIQTQLLVDYSNTHTHTHTHTHTFIYINIYMCVSDHETASVLCWWQVRQASSCLFGPSSSNPLTKTRFIYEFLYLHKPPFFFFFCFFFFFSSFLPLLVEPSFNLIQEQTL